ncbi:iron-sulfur cluster assembly protein 1-like [Triticum aestivum]|uniref:iron-sulfur cluster assembly protein 1-like n=1 Tax=Triticum aestivum TaxID=4565 RepID=UPI001D01B6A4|nr:iron-sulfur cluster assembly protein 1-like [Triticum aestivum]
MCFSLPCPEDPFNERHGKKHKTEDATDTNDDHKKKSKGSKKQERAGAGDSSTGAAVLGAVAARRGCHEWVVDHYSNPHNVGAFDKDDADVGTGLVHAPACGDIVKMQIRIDQTFGRIVNACFKTFGCGFAIASSFVEIDMVATTDCERGS